MKYCSYFWMHFSLLSLKGSFQRWDLHINKRVLLEVLLRLVVKVVTMQLYQHH